MTDEQIAAKYGHRMTPKAYNKASNPPPAKPPRTYEGGKRLDPSKVSPKLAHWIWWASHREQNPLNAVQIHKLLTEYHDHTRRWQIPLRTIQYRCAQPNPPPLGKVRQKGGGRKPAIDGMKEQAIVQQLVDRCKLKRAMPNIALRAAIGKATGHGIASQGQTRRLRRRHRYVLVFAHLLHVYLRVTYA